jgi:hypothetical protein
MLACAALLRYLGWNRADSDQVEMMRGDSVIIRGASNHGRRRRDGRTVHQPFHQRAIGVPKNDIGAAVAIEIASAFDMILRSGVCDRRGGAKKLSRTIQQPNREIAIIVAEQDVITAVAVEIAVSHHMIGRRSRADEGRKAGETIIGDSPDRDVALSWRNRMSA